ncbi:CPBP family intramembrane glutamic endopeptidase [Cupriavidus basilensis]|uniref:CAAX amino terminal protease family protein n=1 Tax=Cupriavidus basilensis TaxID=68895 RepID=A0A0C4YH00_9BURK|nr:CPBP family intramembrane glutamic endopeptidase [Cupriavidus basilensis]AJG21975.1 CAAX amino terminal protease family protein [Cupriavidus basilensis]
MNPNRPDQTRPITFQWALALTFVAWFVEVILTMLLRPALLRNGMQPMAAASLIRVACYGLVFSTLLHASGLSYRKLFHEGGASVAATLGLLGPPILLMVPLILLLDGLAMVGIEALLPFSADDARMITQMTSGGIGIWVLVCVIAPFVEEMFFRGILLRGMLGRYARADATVYSAFVFGVAHLNIYQFVIAFAIGLFAAALYCRTRSLWPGIVLHAGLNTGVMISAAMAPDSTALEAPLSVWALAVPLGLAGAWMLRRLLWYPRGAGAAEGQS